MERNLTNHQKEWAWMFAKGQVNARPGYYGGLEFADPNLFGGWNRQKFAKISDYNKMIESMIREIGINWDETSFLTIDTYYKFDGTERDSLSEPFVVGFLGLHSGTKIMFSSEDVDEYRSLREYLNGVTIAETLKQSIEIVQSKGFL